MLMKEAYLSLDEWVCGEVASASPVPLLIYNWPGVSNGMDVNSDMLDVLGEHPNIVGIKLTCGSIAKVARVAAKFDPSEFNTYSGQSDWLVPALAAGAAGSITGMANFYPKVRSVCLLPFPGTS